MQNKQDYTAKIGSTFSIDLDDGSTHDIELIEVDDVKADTSEAGQAEPFSALFRTSADAGELLLFIVPIGPDDVGMRYEAVFT